jgi:hypothetical protein
MKRWRWIPGAEGIYEVSNDGRVRSYTGANKRSIPCEMTMFVDERNRTMASLRYGGRVRKTFASRLVVEAFIGPIPKGMVVDHINRDPSDNRIKNLRIVTLSQNCGNSPSRPGAKHSKFKGVWRSRSGKQKPWWSTIQIDGRSVHDGPFEKERHAAIAYDRRARGYFGETAYLNFPRIA